MDLGNYLRFVLALVFVLALIGLLAALVRRYGLGMANTAIRKGQERRLKLVEILPIDGKRRAVLLRRDDVEHLVILGATGETVVETQIPSPNRDDFAEVLASIPPQDAPAAKEDV